MKWPNKNQKDRPTFCWLAEGLVWREKKRMENWSKHSQAVATANTKSKKKSNTKLVKTQIQDRQMGRAERAVAAQGSRQYLSRLHTGSISWNKDSLIIGKTDKKVETGVEVWISAKYSEVWRWHRQLIISWVSVLVENGGWLSDRGGWWIWRRWRKRWTWVNRGRRQPKWEKRAKKWACKKLSDSKKDTSERGGIWDCLIRKSQVTLVMMRALLLLPVLSTASASWM